MSLSRLLPFIVGILVFIVDFLTKYYIQHSLPLIQYQFPEFPYGGIGVFKNLFGIEFSIVHATNRGAAWGILADWQQYLLLARIALIMTLIIYVFFYNTKKSWNIPLALIIAGAFSNVVDFFLYGHVIDMLHFVLWGFDYPVFNLADSAIFIGVIWLLFISWWEPSKTLIKTL